MNRTLTNSRTKLALLGAAVLAALAVAPAACWDDDDDVVAAGVYYYDPYAYTYYYTADLAVADWYYADYWYTYPYLYSKVPASGQTVPGDGLEGAKYQAGAVLRALAQGQNVCAGQVTITPKTQNIPCVGNQRAGATVTFNGCQLGNGARLDGVFDVTSTITASDTNCDANTVLTVNYTTTYTNFSYTGPNGGRSIISTQTNQGTYSRAVNGVPNALTVNVNGQAQLLDQTGSLAASPTYSGGHQFSFPAQVPATTYTVAGSLTVRDASGVARTVASTGLTRTSTCCRPTAGTVTVAAPNTSNEVWGYGPDCGDVTANGQDVALPECL